MIRHARYTLFSLRSISMNSLVTQDESLEENDNTQLPLVSFGLITDIQYADVDDGTSYDGLKQRRYRNSLNLLKEAIKNWSIDRERDNLRFLIQLGDIIDAKAHKNNHRDEALAKILGEFSQIPIKLYHIWGNHELYNYYRKDLINTQLNSAKEANLNALEDSNYYTIDVNETLRLICIDFYQFSILGYDTDHVIYQEAHKFLTSHNKNQDLNDPTSLRGHGKRFTAFNGALSDTQLKWLREELEKCKENKLKAIIVGHVPVHPKGASSPMCLAWNYREILELFGTFEKTIVAYFCGHDHDGGYFRDKHNIHHITFPAVLETPPNSNAYATVKVYKDHVSVVGVGIIDQYEIYF
jgi:manganese-dependent ADP-ribose/CDP-alcohol diphosphatase